MRKGRRYDGCGVFGEYMQKLRILRKGKGLTQKQLAELVGVERQTIIRLESGERKPTVALLIKLSRVFRCRPTDLL